MPAYYHIDPLTGYVLVTLEGVVTSADLVVGQRQLHSDELFRGSYPRLVDGRSITKLDVDAGTIRSLAKTAIEQGLWRIALVADSDLVFTIMRMFQGWAYEADCYVSRDMHDGLAWLTRQPNHPVNT